MSTLGLILSIFTFANFIYIAESTSSSCPFIPTEPLPYPTKSPKNVNTKNAILANTTTPLVLQNTLLGFLLLKNTGHALELYGFPEALSSTSLYGGVLCDRVYIFHKLRFYFTSDLNERSNDLVDGVGTPLTLSFVYFDPKYLTFNESLKHRDGVVIVNFQLTVGPIPNLLFIPVGILLQLFREPGTELYLGPAVLAYAWFNDIPIIYKYYTYAGSYYDVETKKYYECATIIVADGQYPQLTKEQFQAFLTLKTNNGSRLELVSPRVFPTGKRKVMVAYGLQGVFPII